MEWIIDERKRVGRKDVLIGYLEDGGVVKSAQIAIPRKTQPTAQDIQAAWESGVVIPGGAKLWRQLQLREAHDNVLDVIDAILAVVRASPTPTMAAILTAGEGAIAGNPRQQALYNRILSVLNTAPNNTERWRFLGLLATMAFAQMGRR